MTTASCKRVQLTGTVTVDLRLDRAYALFTPSGERTWATGWDPKFLISPANETESGTVFTVNHSGSDSVWTVIHAQAGEYIEYSVMIPEERAGLVRVACVGSGNGTTATVSYDLTSLSPAANGRLEHFAASYPQFLLHWQLSIAAAVGRDREP